MTEPGDVTVDVVVPTYRRPADLERCLSAIAAQTQPAAQVVVVARENDVASHQVVRAAVAHLPCLRLVTVNEPGVIAAMSAGVAATTGPIVAFTDDDAAPHPHWLDRILRHFEDPTVGAVGGRDVVWHDGPTVPPDQPVVGRVQWFGRVVGNHHLGVGPAREVDVLKGVNCAYRRDVLVGTGFDPRLRGPGAQVHWELSLGLALRRAGWRLIYDPAILVDHFEAQRHDVPRVGVAKTAGRAVADATFNETIVLLDHLEGRHRVAYLVWSTTVGTRAAPGLIQAVRLTLLHGPVGVRRWWAATSGRMAAFREGSQNGVPSPFGVTSPVSADAAPSTPTTPGGGGIDRASDGS